MLPDAGFDDIVRYDLEGPQTLEDGDTLSTVSAPRTGSSPSSPSP